MSSSLNYAQKTAFDQLNEACGAFVKWLYDDKVEEISVNPDGKILVFTTDRGKIELDNKLDAGTANTIMNLVATYNHKDLTKEFLLETQFPLNAGRFSGSVAPYSQPGAKTDDSTSVGNNMPSFSIRCGGKKIYPIDQLLESGMIEEEVQEIFKMLVQERKTVLVAGATGSGKTSLLNTMLLETTRLTPEDRVIIITDIDDVICFSPDCLVLMADAKISMRDLGIHSMRRSPKRIVFGEVRAGEAMEAVTNWATGHSGGMLTIHAKSAALAPKRLRTACLMGVTADKDELSHRIADAIDAVIYVQQDSSCTAGRRVTEICNVKDYDEETSEFNIEYLYKLGKPSETD